MRIAMFCSSLLLVGACLDDGKGPEEELLEEGKDDSFRAPTNHGAIPFGAGQNAVLTEAERYHAWTFELSGNANVDMTTSYLVLGQRRTDTVLYLYKEGPTGWGPYIARNDDYGTTTYSKLVRSLGAGRYRALVKGHLSTTMGKFKLTVNCSGAGCAAPAPVGCLFGETYGDIETNGALTTINSNVITAANLSTLNVDDQRRLMLAVRQSSHTDVQTPLEAIGRVDQGEVNVTWLYEPAARRAYIAFEYGAGDNSYGAIFDRHSAQMVTAIHDGDLTGCIVQAETCMLPEDWNQLQTSTAYTTESSRVVTMASELSGYSIDQAMVAFGRSYDNLTGVADGLSRVDGNKLDVVNMKHKATGVRLEVMEYGAGDTSVGMVYYRGGTDRAGIINDLFIEGCTLFE